jgi:predicted Zn-dependent peptidase
MSNLARQQMHFGRFFSLDELVDSIETVTADHVQRIAREFFDPNLLAISVLGNLGKWKITRDDLTC